jgi:hypothetical protein
VAGVTRDTIPDIGAYEFGFATGIGELIGEALIHCWPNPASSFITIENLSGQQELDLLICNLSGKIILQKQIQGVITSVDLKGIANGIYLLQFKSDGIFYERKLIVVNEIK